MIPNRLYNKYTVRYFSNNSLENYIRENMLFMQMLEAYTSFIQALCMSLSPKPPKFCHYNCSNYEHKL